MPKGVTRWFPRHVHPARVGIYECAVRISYSVPPILWKLEWDGVGFLVPCAMVVERWRGLTKRAAQEGSAVAVRLIPVVEMADAQELADRWYAKHGPCCAGCDWWRQHNSIVGECHRSAPVPARERVGMLGVHGHSYPLIAGHVMTPREHHCGDFKDDFDWSTLPPHYLRRIGWDQRQGVRNG